MHEFLGPLQMSEWEITQREKNEKLNGFEGHCILALQLFPAKT